MATLGFVGMPLSTDGDWKEYRFEGRAALLEHLPLVRLPYPRIDGLHVLVYRSFCDAVALCLGSADISDHFHVRYCFFLCSSIIRFVYFSRGSWYFNSIAPTSFS
eukprot:TRINITY_DN4954_c0_g2_i1.p1 TRINITY_DN4954_c0_g2~~TRINITY_DN4954_c0_g2_i1.p1  ORF type:complete len:119 (+),score=16.48 TRINITY_DN4954_c0_g2_i1:45-359(+)